MTPGGWPPPRRRPAYAEQPQAEQPHPDQPPADQPHREAQRYPRLLRTDRWRWWRPVLGVLLAGVLFLVLNGVLLLASFALGVLAGPRYDVLNDLDASVSDPLVLLAGNLSIVAMIPAALGAVVIVHREQPRWLLSVTGRVRGRLLARCAGLAGVTVTVSVGLNVLLGLALEPESGPLDGAAVPPVATLLALAVVIAVSTPLQSAAEEVLFRGYLAQAVGSFGRGRVMGPTVAALVTAALFAAAHLPEGGWLVADLAVFALVASWLTWRTGGIEAAIALHVVNNLVAIALAAATGTLDDAVGASTIPWPYAVIDIVALLGYLAAVTRWAAPAADRVTREPAGPARAASRT